MLQIRGIQKSFGAQEVLCGVDLDVMQGDVIAILGPSGSGKTTLLRCINFLETADGGTIRLTTPPIPTPSPTPGAPSA